MKRAWKILYYSPERTTIGSGSARNRRRSETPDGPGKNGSEGLAKSR